VTGREGEAKLLALRKDLEGLVEIRGTNVVKLSRNHRAIVLLTHRPWRPSIEADVHGGDDRAYGRAVIQVRPGSAGLDTSMRAR